MLGFGEGAKTPVTPFGMMPGGVGLHVVGAQWTCGDAGRMGQRVRGNHSCGTWWVLKLGAGKLGRHQAGSTMAAMYD